jgi:hypothetical protein
MDEIIRFYRLFKTAVDLSRLIGPLVARSPPERFGTVNPSRQHRDSDGTSSRRVNWRSDGMEHPSSGDSTPNTSDDSNLHSIQASRSA